MRRLLLIVLFVGVFFVQPLHATASVVWLDVTAKIDGSDCFEITGNTWRWQHYTRALPEYHEGQDPTVVDGDSILPQSFLSSWSSGAGYGAFSDYNTVTGLTPIQDTIDLSTLTFAALSGRDYNNIVQIPVSTNGYTLKVYFNDDGWGGHDFYRFQITGEPLSNNGGSVVPEPASLSLLGLGLLRFVFKRKKVA